MRFFYQGWPIAQTLSAQSDDAALVPTTAGQFSLLWSHYVNAEKLPEDKKELRSNMQRILHHLAKLPEHAMSYFRNRFVEYAAGPV